MDIKQKTRDKLEAKIEEIEKLIAHKGIGSRYVKKVERVQRNINLTILAGLTVTILGIAAWMTFNKSQEEED